jgi:hypothetical protein
VAYGIGTTDIAGSVMRRSPSADKWRAVRDAIRAEVCEKGWSAEAGRSPNSMAQWNSMPAS